MSTSTGTTGGTGAAPPALPATTVVTPTIGGVAHGHAWVGGQPDSTWTTTTRTAPATPLCYRVSSPEQAQKTYKARVTPASTAKLFKIGDPDYPLEVYAQDLETHMQTHGMDSLFYVACPSTGDMVYTLTDHARILKVNAVASATTFHALYDDFDKDNHETAKQYILATLDPTLKIKLHPFLRKGMNTVVELWMTIVGKDRTESVQRYEGLIDKAKALRLSQFPGEDVELYASAMLKLCSELEIAQQLPDNMIYHISCHLSQGTHEEFRQRRMLQKMQVSVYLKELSGKTAQARAVMPPTSIMDPDSILAAALEDFNEFKLADNWLPAPGKGVPLAPAGYYCLNQEQINALVLKQGQEGGDRKCYNCNKSGHVKKDCPEPKRATTPSTTPSTPATEEKAWRRVAPKNGEPETQTRGPHIFKWCATCTKWWTSHGTADHKGRDEVAAAATPPAAGATGADAGTLGMAMAPIGLLSLY